MIESQVLPYLAGELECEGMLVFDKERSRTGPLLLLAPNWLGVTDTSIAFARDFADRGYVVLVIDMFGAGKRPTGGENPAVFLAPLLKSPAITRERVNAALEALTTAGATRGIGDGSRRAAIGYCFGGANVLDLARSGSDIAAVVSMHGTLATSMPAERGQVKAYVLAVHGADDPVAPTAEREGLEAEMRQAQARWALLALGNVHHAFTDPKANKPPIAAYSESATRYGNALAHMVLEDAFAGRI